MNIKERNHIRFLFWVHIINQSTKHRNWSMVLKIRISWWTYDHINVILCGFWRVKTNGSTGQVFRRDRNTLYHLFSSVLYITMDKGWMRSSKGEQKWIIQSLSQSSSMLTQFFVGTEDRRQDNCKTRDILLVLWQFVIYINPAKSHHFLILGRMLGYRDEAFPAACMRLLFYGQATECLKVAGG